MKKVYIITRQNINNYGSFLQSYVTQQKIEELGFSVSIINYIPKEEKFNNIINTNCINSNRHGIKKLLYMIFSYPLYTYSYILFSKLRFKYLNLTKKVNYKNIGKLEANIFLSGSDQIWGRIGTKNYDLNYFLSFTNSKNKFAYASSFGHNDLNEIDSHVLESLRKYKKIGVREKSAVDFLKSVDIDSKLVLDPVFLFDKEYYFKKILFTKDMRKDYILVYQIHKNIFFDEYVKKLSNELKLPIYRVHNNPSRIFKQGRLKNTQNPFKFLGYIYNAKYIITDSFHCTSFSVIFNKQFVSINPGKTSTRIASLLNSLGISERLIDCNDKNTISLPIDYQKVNLKLSTLKNDSISFLKEELNFGE